MRNPEKQSYQSLIITLAIIGIFLTCVILSQVPKVALNLTKQDNAMAGAVEPSDSYDPNATEPPDEPLEEDNETATPVSTRTPFPTITLKATATPFPTQSIAAFETESPAPTFDTDIPAVTTPTLSPTPKPVVKSSSNIGLIIGAVVGTILLVIGIVWVILSRQNQSSDYTMPAPPTTPTQQPYPPGNFTNTPAQPSEWAQPAEPQAPYTTPYDQYIGTNNPDQQK